MTTSSPLPGATLPAQFAPVDQLLSGPPPSQVLVVASAGVTRSSVAASVAAAPIGTRAPTQVLIALPWPFNQSLSVHLAVAERERTLRAGVVKRESGF